VSCELVIFDCDGVLIDSEPIANRVFAEQLGAAGLRLTVDEVMSRFVGKTRAGCLELAAELLGRRLPEAFGDDWDKALFAALESEARATDGVAELLRELDVRYCVASNSSPDRMRISLKAAGLLDFFEDRLFSAVAVARPKPAPDLFLHAARSMNVRPSGCVVIEDTPTGVQAALAAGMTVFGYAAGVPALARKLEAAGAITFDSMSAAKQLLTVSRTR
jgi:HAD superfamily hydrolase (TIGR01509 family)